VGTIEIVVRFQGKLKRLRNPWGPAVAFFVKLNFPKNGIFLLIA
jgi:hypothetical protein